MIIVADRISKLDVEQLMLLYKDDIETARRERYKSLPEAEGRLRAERDYERYLRDVFFSQMSARMFVLEEKGVYASAVCLESFSDGLLLNSLITTSCMRRKGYGEQLVRYALQFLSGKCVYAHIHYKNKASVALHEKLGFVRLHEYAHMLDGSVRSDHYTYKRF